MARVEDRAQEMSQIIKWLGLKSHLLLYFVFYVCIKTQINFPLSGPSEKQINYQESQKTSSVEERK